VTQYKRIAIDRIWTSIPRTRVGTSKAVFTLHGIDQQDRPVLRINLRREQVIPFFAKLPPPRLPWKPVVALTIGLAN
jgi:hypothetical protein